VGPHEAPEPHVVDLLQPRLVQQHDDQDRVGTLRPERLYGAPHSVPGAEHIVDDYDLLTLEPGEVAAYGPLRLVIMEVPVDRQFEL